ncbi:hypothetical protein [Sorangium sp. So ce1024]|uniref:hypothetical protein n=1 Tax=Sorangium sp. So ce1024 TaxID=3133327 RepID=UPI003EFC9E87
MSLSALIARAEDAREAALLRRGATAAEIAGATGAARERLERARGFSNERRVLAALHAVALPNWIVHVRAGRTTEDLRGGDIAVICTDGRFWLQIKSSQAGAERFLEEARRRGRVGQIGIVVVPDRLNDRQIVVRVIAALIGMRAARATEGRRP